MSTKTILIIGAIAFGLWFLYEHLALEIKSDFDAVNTLAGLPKVFNLKDLVESASTTGTQKAIRFSVTLN